MANKRNPRKGDPGRDGGGFVALPWSVLDCPAYQDLSHPAKALLMEFARQYVRDNNGRLLASRAYLKGRGWRSTDVITRATRELVEAGFVHQTVMGHRPNKASWFAVTWRMLDKIPGYDPCAATTFMQGAYRKNAPLKPPHGVEGVAIAPPHGVGRQATRPPPGTIRPGFPTPPTPPYGHHLDIPSPGIAEPVSTDSEAFQALANVRAAAGCHAPGTQRKPDRMAAARQAQQDAIDRHPKRKGREPQSATVHTIGDGFTRVIDEFSQACPWD